MGVVLISTYASKSAKSAKKQKNKKNKRSKPITVPKHFAEIEDFAAWSYMKTHFFPSMDGEDRPGPGFLASKRSKSVRKLVGQQFYLFGPIVMKCFEVAQADPVWIPFQEHVQLGCLPEVRRTGR
jgi:hypothetical protein